MKHRPHGATAFADSLAQVLRELPGFPEPLPILIEAMLPDDPDELFLDWLDAAIRSGARQPHALSFVTSRSDGTPVARTLILKGLDECGYHFATYRTSRKGSELETNPRASLLFFWRESGRQVRITGSVFALDAEASQRDWEARPNYTGVPNPDWQRYVLVPDEFEFLQATEDRKHSRFEYLSGRDEGWIRRAVDTPSG